MGDVVTIRQSAKASLDEISLWEHQVDALPHVTKVLPSDYLRLEAILRMASDVDSYLTSPTYYLFTGRNGLWRYSSNGGDVLFCWHPNHQGHVLIFPPVIEDDIAAVRDLLQILPQPPEGLSLARIKAGEHGANVTGMLQSSCRSLNFSVVKESVLDWLYPVRILSTDLVRQTAGNKFRNVRKGLIHMRAHDVRKEKLDLRVHKQAVRSLLHRWASLSSKTKEEYAELYDTYDRLFALSHKLSDSLEGLVYFVDGNIEAVSLWDVSEGAKRTANLYVNFCNTDIEGLSDYTVVSVCDVLSRRGIDLLNLGGSEISSLDFFKCKFRPVINIDLLSVDINLGSASEVLNAEHRTTGVQYAQA